MPGIINNWFCTHAYSRKRERKRDNCAAVRIRSVECTKFEGAARTNQHTHTHSNGRHIAYIHTQTHTRTHLKKAFARAAAFSAAAQAKYIFHV